MLGDGQAVVRLFGGGPFLAWIEALCRSPLPPYLQRRTEDSIEEKEDRERYQTLFAARRGAVAAPTAGLHFTERVFEGLADRGIEWVAITLHVGLGTFQPVGTDRLEDHVMEAERYEVGREAAQAVRRAAAEGRRVIAPSAPPPFAPWRARRQLGGRYALRG